MNAGAESEGLVGLRRGVGAEAQRASSDHAVLDRSFSVLFGNPTPEELAAVTAVIEAMIEEQGDNDRRRVGRGMSGWQRSQRSVREPLRPGFGAWRGFSGK